MGKEKTFGLLKELEEEIKVLTEDLKDCKEDLCKNCKRQHIFDPDWCKECRWSDDDLSN